MRKSIILLFIVCLLTACSGQNSSMESAPEKTSSQFPAESMGREEASVGSMHLYGEQHGVKAIYDRELDLWKGYYEEEHMRHLFLELPYYTAQYLNLWMESDSDQILDEIYDDWDQTASHVEDYRNFFKQIKAECPETVFHGTDVGHQFATTGQRYLDWLLENGQGDSENYRIAEENMEQGKQFYSENDFVYREQKMVENFCREAAAVDGADIMGIYGGAHLGGTVSGTDVPAMAVQLRELYGDRVSGGDLTMVGKEDMEPLEVQALEIAGKEYSASYFGEENLEGMIQGITSRQFWRLEDAYEDFSEAEKSGDVLPYNNYPMAVETGQVFMIIYQMTDGTEMTLFYRSDGNEWNGMAVTEGIVAEAEPFSR